MSNGSNATPSPSADALSGPDPTNEMWLPARRTLLGWLRQKAPPLAELYESAVIELERQQLAGRSRIIAHCVREIANTLPSILAQVERTRLEYDKELDAIAIAWDRLAVPGFNLTSVSAQGEISNPSQEDNPEFFRLLASLIERHKSTNSRALTIAERLFRADRPENRHLGDALVPILRQWLDLKKWFVARAHENRKDADCDWAEFRRQFALFEKTLLTLGQGFFVTLGDLDELIRTSTPDHIDTVIAHLGHIEHYRYFFERLHDPAWIAALQSKGIFKRPPPVEQGLLPRWAVSEYLVRVADTTEDASTVMNALLEIASALRKEADPNPFVIRDIINASLKLPVDQVVRIVPQLKLWLHLPHGVFFWRRLGLLIVSLAEQNRAAEALSLLSSLLAIERPTASDTDWIYQSAKPRIGLFDYRSIVNECVPAILRAIGRPVLDILCSLLERIAKLSRRSHAEQEWDDNSPHWYPIIAEQDDDEREEVCTIVVAATRDAAEYLVREGEEDLGALVESLEARRWLIFERLALHLLQAIPTAPGALIAAKLTQEALFNERNIRAEYELLLRRCFVNLTLEEKRIILGWIDSGPPDLEQRILRWKRQSGEEPTQEAVARYRRQWQWDRLAPCTNGLPQDWQERYDELAAEFGEPVQRPARIEARLVAIGERSPLSEEELAAFNPEELRQYLLTWRPDPHEFPRPTLTDLSQVLTNIVMKKPEKYAISVAQWEGLDPTYLHGIVRGFTKAIQEGRQLAWEKALELCAWILQQPRRIANQSVDRFEADPDWNGTRWWIVELLRVGLRHASLAIPIDLREKVWDLLEILTDDPDPEPGDEEEDSGRPGKSMDRAVNSIRGRAIETLIFYPGWIKTQSGYFGPETQPAEARAVLARHLDREMDASLAIRSLYGRWFRWMFVFDPQWATSVLSQVFPEADRQYWLVAWDGFIRFNNPYDELFEMLQPLYSRAVEDLASPEVTGDDTRHIRDKRCASHLMTFYWRGLYRLQDEGGLLGKFFAIAPDKIRAEAIEFVGRSLARTKGSIDSLVLDRIKRLLDWRLDHATQDVEMNRAELKAFGWCFGSHKFEPSWAISNLIRVVRSTQSIDPDFLVLESLPDYAAEYPNEAIECARHLIQGQSSHIELSSWDGDLRRLFMHTRDNLMPDVRRASNEVIEVLGRLGYVGYRDLLSSN